MIHEIPVVSRLIFNLTIYVLPYIFYLPHVKRCIMYVIFNM